MVRKKVNGLAFIQDKKTGGGVVLDKSRYDSGALKIEKVNGLFVELSGRLAWFDPEPGVDLILRVYRGGVPALKAMAEEKFEEWATKHDCPDYLRAEGRRKAVAAIPPDLLEKIQGLLEEIHYVNTKELTLPFTPEELEYDKEKMSLQIGDAYNARFWAACADQVSAEDVDDAKTLCKVLEELRKIDANGYAVALLVQRFIGNRYDDPASLPKIEISDVLPVMRRYPFRVITRDDAQAAGGNRLASVRALTEASTRAATLGYYSNMTPQPSQPRPEAAPDGGQPGQFAGVVGGLRDLGFDV